MAERVDPRVVTRLESRVRVAVGAGYVLTAVAVVLCVVRALDGDRTNAVGWLVLAALALMLGLVIWLCGLLAQLAIGRLESDAG